MLPRLTAREKAARTAIEGEDDARAGIVIDVDVEIPAGVVDSNTVLI